MWMQLNKLKKIKYFLGVLLLTLFAQSSFSQEEQEQVYKKRVLEVAELDFLNSYYSQDGDNAAVTGGIGTERLEDLTGTVIISIPLSDDDVLTIDAGVSAYTSASSGNVNPFDSDLADPFIASSGESTSDVWTSIAGSLSHSSDDRNKIYSAGLSFSNEYDYTSIGLNGGFTHLFNEKNTEISFRGSAYFDSWSLIYPAELRPTGRGSEDEEDEEDFDINKYTIKGNINYNPSFTPLSANARNSFSIGLGFSQILSKNLQGSFAADFVLQKGLLSTPFQRVYFADVPDSFIENFHLADDIERLPDSRQKIAMGGRLHYYFSEWLTARSFVRYYFDDWGIKSYTASIELPIKIGSKFTLYPSYRIYDQTSADYFGSYEQTHSSQEFYTSDHDLSDYKSNQYGFGVSYTDILTQTHLWKLGLKSIDLRFYKYDRNTTFTSYIVSTGVKFVLQ